ncbi:hypothetical protein L1987_15498 [Smallanthus sonchifolius]|uniref:Uncharacterized protein n=1 Tax=Smallanthus sonchifolius TaxID=185202 RepID=A0ACB9J7V9_9ASTR|nr:hypothetical protein L1987_15498 [Smallanthus sonchifolius]
MEVATIFLLAFSLRFFRKSFAVELSSSESRYLGIRYKKISVSTLVWVANREQPLGSASALVLKIKDPAILVLFKNMSMIWSSNKTMESRNATAKLHDTGNLVLMDQHEKVLWQSFDYPTEHWLPGMKIGTDYLRGVEWHLSSWKSSQHPVVGEFTWGADVHGYPERKLKQGSRVILRGEPWSNQRFSRISEFNGNLTVTYNMWVEAGMNWQLGASFSQDICDTYNICSAYGSCIHNMTEQSCVCFDETRFEPRSKKAWKMADWSVAQSNSIMKGGNIKIILPVIFTGVLIGFISSWLWHARKNKNHAEPIEEGVILNVSKSPEDAMELPQFKFSTIVNATANFSPENKLGEGGFGPVYKC